MNTTSAHSRTSLSAPAGSAEDFASLASLPEGPQRQAVRSRVIHSWLPLAHRLALRFRDRGETLEDLRQVAALGLVKAVDRYDPALTHAFESFAIPTITGELKRHFRDNTWSVHVPRRVQELRNRVRAAEHELSGAVDHRPSNVSKLAAYTGLEEADVLAGLEALRSYRSLSLDATSGPDDRFSLGDRLGTAEPGYRLVEDREAVRPALARLSERDRHVLRMRFFHNMTQTAIAAELHVSQMHVSRLISGACTRVRDEANGVAPTRPAPRRAKNRPVNS